MYRTRLLAGAILATLAQTAGAQTIANLPFPSPGVQPGRNTLDLYLAPSPLPGRPTVVVLFGGGYVGGSKADVGGVCAALAARGYSAVAPNYSLATPTFPTSPQAMRDAIASVAWVRSAGAAYGLNPKVVISGFSAGATIGVAAAMASGTPTFVDPGLPAGSVARIDLAVGFFGRYDMVWNLGAAPMPDWVYTFVGAAPGSPGLLAALAGASAASFVRPCSAPAALFHGGSDTLVPVQNSQRLAAALTNAGVPNSLQINPTEGHGYGTLGGNAGAAGFIIDAVVALMGSGCDVPPGSPGACCTNFACVRTFPPDCTGVFTPGSLCTPGVCPPAPPLMGTCCWGVRCAMLDAAACSGANMRFLGALTACAPVAGGCCPADFTQNGVRAVDDLFAYLAAWLDHSPSATAGTTGTPAVADLFAFLSAWFAGC